MVKAMSNYVNHLSALSGGSLTVFSVPPIPEFG
jgi:hypothetical protein